MPSIFRLNCLVIVSVKARRKKSFAIIFMFNATQSSDKRVVSCFQDRSFQFDGFTYRIHSGWAHLRKQTKRVSNVDANDWISFVSGLELLVSPIVCIRYQSTILIELIQCQSSMNHNECHVLCNSWCDFYDSEVSLCNKISLRQTNQFLSATLCNCDDIYDTIRHEIISPILINCSLNFVNHPRCCLLSLPWRLRIQIDNFSIFISINCLLNTFESNKVKAQL